MYKLDNFKSCCDYLGIDNTLPVCQIDGRKIQAAYKLRVCVAAWNRQDGFEPDETASYYQKDVGYTPHFHHKDGKLLSSGLASIGSNAGIVHASVTYAAAFTYANVGLRLCLSTPKRAVEFGKTFIETFNELV